MPNVERYMAWRALLQQNPQGIMRLCEASRLLGMSRQAIRYHLLTGRWPSVEKLPGDRRDVVYLPTADVLDRFANMYRNLDYRENPDPQTFLEQWFPNTIPKV